VTKPAPATQAEHNRQTRDAYDRLASVADAGFVIDRIAEPQSSQEALERFPSELAHLAGVPIFIVYRLRLVG
jgi:hypothetical protein